MRVTDTTEIATCRRIVCSWNIIAVFVERWACVYSFLRQEDTKEGLFCDHILTGGMPVEEIYRRSIWFTMKIFALWDHTTSVSSSTENPTDGQQPGEFYLIVLWSDTGRKQRTFKLGGFSFNECIWFCQEDFRTLRSHNDRIKFHGKSYRRTAARQIIAYCCDEHIFVLFVS